jgi:hypothetical protein
MKSTYWWYPLFLDYLHKECRPWKNVGVEDEK